MATYCQFEISIFGVIKFTEMIINGEHKVKNYF
jgi:hypothetical protein